MKVPRRWTAIIRSGIDQVIDLVLLADVGLNGEAALTQRLDFAAHRGGIGLLLRPGIVDDDIGALGREGNGDAGADARAATGDYRSLICKPGHGGLRSVKR